MTVTLYQTPQQPIIIQGFPGFGLIGSIVTEYLVNSPDVKPLGHIFIDNMPAIAIIHEGRLLHPAGLFYNEKYNLIIVHTLAPLQGFEWSFAEEILQLYRRVNAKLLLSVEGVGTQTEDNKIYGYANNHDSTQEFLQKNGVPVLTEGILFGISAALMLKVKQNDLNMVGLYATTHSQLPDSVGASEVIKTLDKLFGFNIDPAPLLGMAQEFEEKVKQIMTKSSQAIEEKESMNYVG